MIDIGYIDIGYKMQYVAVNSEILFIFPCM